jgi:hypothetical protein
LIELAGGPAKQLGKRSSIFARRKRCVEPIEIAVTAIPVTSAAENTATTIRVGRLANRSRQVDVDRRSP